MPYWKCSILCKWECPIRYIVGGISDSNPEEGENILLPKSETIYQTARNVIEAAGFLVSAYLPRLRASWTAHALWQSDRVLLLLFVLIAGLKIRFPDPFKFQNEKLNNHSFIGNYGLLILFCVPRLNSAVPINNIVFNDLIFLQCYSIYTIWLVREWVIQFVSLPPACWLGK